MRLLSSIIFFFQYVRQREIYIEPLKELNYSKTIIIKVFYFMLYLLQIFIEDLYPSFSCFRQILSQVFLIFYKYNLNLLKNKMQFPSNFYSIPLTFYPTGQEVFFNPYFTHFPLFLYNKQIQQNAIENQREQKILKSCSKNDIRTFKLEELNKQRQKMSPKTQCEQDSEYEPQKIQILNFYKKKNTESNIINQVFSFLSSQKSQPMMMRILDQSQEQVNKFYTIMKRIKKYNKRYMNRNYILDLLKLEENGVNHKILIKSKVDFDLIKLRRVLRIIIKYFFSQQCTISLLTSKKMNKMTLRQHFLRKREVQEFLNSQIFNKK